MMWFYMKLAWRNLFRNKRRTLIAGTAMGIGLAALIFFDAVMLGSVANLIRSTTDSFMGHAQIHRKGYQDSQKIEDTIVDSAALLDDLAKEKKVEAYAPRAYALATISSPLNLQSVEMIGVDPELERKVSQVAGKIKNGVFFANPKEKAILIGSKMAEDLDVSSGDRVVLTTARIGSGDVSQELFRVGAVFQTGMRELDAGIAFVRLSDFQKITGIGSGIHEIAIRFKDIKTSEKSHDPFWAKYSRHGNEAVSWEKALPLLKSFFENLGKLRGFMALLLLAVVVFGIINTLFMSLYERMFEFAVMRAVGTRPAGIRKLMVFEAGALGIVSIVFGIVLALLVVFLFNLTGVAYGGIEFGGGTIQGMVYPILEAAQFILYPLGIFLFTCIVGLYPAFIAGRMNVADAMRKSI